jgi:putative peptidoglycan lipid II flippase
MRMSLVAVIVPDYDEGIAFFRDALGFNLVQDSDLGGGKRWVTMRPAGGGTGVLIAKAANASQRAAIGRQAGGRVGFFLETDDFARDHVRMVSAGVTFRESPRHEDYGTVAVFEDRWGNPWDLIQPNK